MHFGSWFKGKPWTEPRTQSAHVQTKPSSWDSCPTQLSHKSSCPHGSAVSNLNNWAAGTDCPHGSAVWIGNIWAAEAGSAILSPKQLSPGSRLPHSSAVSDLSMAFSGRKRRGLNPCNLVPHKPINLHKPKPTQTYTNCLKNSWKFIARLQVDLESTNHNPAKICHEPRFVSWFILIPPSVKPVAFFKTH